MRWDGCLHEGFELSSGLLQGSPSASWLFILLLTPWLMTQQLKLHRSEILVVFKDDVWFSAWSCMVFELMRVVLLRSTAGLEINLERTCIQR
eukprot:1586969-Amphidinium_carterae.1